MPAPLLVDVDWLAGHLGDSEVRVFDTTVQLIRPPEGGPYQVVSGRPEYDSAHIPGAGFADIAGELSADDSPSPFTVPSPERFGSAAGRLGIGEGVRVVLYAQDTPMWATRMWWLMRYFGFDDASVLDGEAVVDGEARSCLINALLPPVFRGEGISSYSRPGRIPRSVNAPWTTMIDPETNRFRSPPELARELDAVTGPGDQPVIAYCGGGISATVDLFALALIGRDDARLYDGSLTEWSRDPALPLETG